MLLKVLYNMKFYCCQGWILVPSFQLLLTLFRAGYITPTASTLGKMLSYICIWQGVQPFLLVPIRSLWFVCSYFHCPFDISSPWHVMDSLAISVISHLSVTKCFSSSQCCCWFPLTGVFPHPATNNSDWFPDVHLTSLSKRACLLKRISSSTEEGLKYRVESS